MAQGIVPTLIVVRVGMGVSTQDIMSYATNLNAHNIARAGPRFTLPMSFRHTTDMEIATCTYELDSRFTVPIAGGDKVHSVESVSK